jgi:hypothetical protein
MGLPIHKTTRTRAKIADKAPWVEVLTNILRHLIFVYGTSRTDRAKLEDQHGMELVYVVGGERPVDISQLIHSVFDTRSPLDIEFTEEERGKVVWFAVRWENTRGEKGPWSEIYFAIIP